MSSSLQRTFFFSLPRVGSFLLFLPVLLVWNMTTIQAGSLPLKKDKDEKPGVPPCFLTVEAYVQDESSEACQNETVTLIAEANNFLPASINDGQARKAVVSITYTWFAPAGASLNTYTGDEVIASFNTSGPKTFTVIATDGVCSASATVNITANPTPDITIFFPNSLSVVPVSGVMPTITMTTLPTTIQATQGDYYEWAVVIDRINGYEIRQGESNTSGIFQVGHVGPYTLTVTGSNGCKRTVRGVLVSPP